MIINFLTSRSPLNKDAGLLIIRIMVGLSMMIFHGYSKIRSGIEDTEGWARTGQKMSLLGIEFLPAFWGFMAGFAEFFCSFLIIIGFLFRPALVLLAFTMFIAVLFHLNLPPESPASGWKGASHALELLAVYIGLFFTGPGKYRV